MAISEKRKRYLREWYKKNSERLRKKSNAWAKEWRAKNPKKAKEQDKLSRERNRERRLEYAKEWYQANKNRNDYRKRKNEYRNNRRKNDPKFHLDTNFAIMILKALKEKKEGRRWEKLVGYTLNDLRKHLEKKFNGRMAWDNYGSYWHIDHIIPKSKFCYTSSKNKEFKKCWALNNLQPLEGKENLRKNCRDE